MEKDRFNEDYTPFEFQIEKDVDSDYDEFIKYLIESNKLVRLTNAQSKFAKWCLSHKEVMLQVGEFTSIFDNVRSFLRQEARKSRKRKSNDK